MSDFIALTTEQPDETPECSRCGCPVTTGAMALLCPAREECEFWPAEGVSPEFQAMYPDRWSAKDKADFRTYCAAVTAVKASKS